VQERTLLKPSAQLQEAAQPIWDQILRHPYLQELRSGMLPLETFRFYVQQDWLYLQAFARTVAAIAGRSSDPEVTRFLLDWVQPLVGMEYHFHKKHANILNLDFEHITWEMNEANWAYSRHMLTAAHAGSTAEALAALLPCPCVYAYVGKVLAEGPPSPNEMYADWIAFYAPNDEGYRPRVIALETLYDRVAQGADAATLARCAQNYLVSSRYEWWFWDTAYKRRMWPV
jgi:thiaminase/transcriptional activator TenA